MSTATLQRPSTPVWLHRWAVGTVVATFVVLALGSIVTTFRVGMADPIWPTAPWHLLFISWEEPQPGYLIEHGHRLAAYVAGLCLIVAAVGLWYAGPSRLRRLSLLALGAIIIQGLLGGYRVRLHAWLGTDLAFLHGCFAQVVLGLVISLAVVTVPGSPWAQATEWGAATTRCQPLRRWVVWAVVLIFGQIVVGAWVRHTGSAFGQRVHLWLAFAVVLVAGELLRQVWRDPTRDRPLRLGAILLTVVIGGQIILGVETWLMRHSAGWLLELRPMTVGQAVVRTAHVLGGSAALALAVALAWRAYGPVPGPAASAPGTAEEGAA
ncbi:MAG: COX15/CtaA family protein [Gemmataceae bacterium]|nr:COX15/CtaA family protein [Gemmataceae bacterium]